MKQSQSLQSNPDCVLSAPAAELVNFASTTPFDALFYLALNTLRMRGETAALQEVRRTAAADGDESLDRRFAAVRACGDPAAALDLVEHEGGVLSMVPDLIAAAREAGRVMPLLEYCVQRKALPSWYKPIAGLHALLAQLTGRADDALRAQLDILPWGADDFMQSTAAASRVKLVGIVKVHNEGARVLRIVETMLAFCDAVVLWDHRSDDGSLDALAKLEPGERARLELIRSTAGEYNERIIYDELFARARARHATHICHFDADEILFTALPLERLRAIAARLMPGDVASIELVQLVGTAGDYLDFSSAAGLAATQYYLPQWRDFMYADDGRALHAQSHLHGGWLPHDSLKRRAFIDPQQAVNFHMDKPDAETAKIKNDWYKAKEIVLHGFPLEKLVYRYMFFALTYAQLEKNLGHRLAINTTIDAAIEARRTAEKRVELRNWLGAIQSPLEKWLFFYV